MKARMTIALASLISGLVALYLHLWKLGLVGQLACANGGGCETVQTSAAGSFLGVDVALIGALGYAAIVVLSLISLQPRFVRARWPALAMMALIYPALLFTIRLKYAEFVTLRSFCPWCAVNAIAIVICAIAVTVDWFRLQGATGSMDPSQPRSEQSDPVPSAAIRTPPPARPARAPSAPPARRPPGPS